jgi:hypothetical protein
MSFQGPGSLSPPPCRFLDGPFFRKSAFRLREEGGGAAPAAATVDSSTAAAMVLSLAASASRRASALAASSVRVDVVSSPSMVCMVGGSLKRNMYLMVGPSTSACGHSAIRSAASSEGRLPPRGGVAYCPGNAGVNAFDFFWAGSGLNWIFPPMNFVVRAVQHLKISKVAGVNISTPVEKFVFLPCPSLRDGYFCF